jgi:hypothetical protein
VKLHRMNFDGSALQRGFWVYVWSIHTPGRRVLYVGRTGDSSSLHAASPFARVGAHLDSRPNAKANSLYRHLQRVQIEPTTASFNMTAVGPIFPECSDRVEHNCCHDVTGALERALGEWLIDRGYTVLSVDKTKAPVDRTLLAQVKELLDTEFPQRVPADIRGERGA